MVSQGSLLGRGLVNDVGFQQENHPVVSFQAEASVEQFRVYLGVDFGGAGQGLVSGTFLGERETLGGGGAGASYPGDWTWRKGGDRTVVVAGSAVESAEHLAAYSVRQGVAEAFFVADAADVDAAGITSLSAFPGDSFQRAARVEREIFRVSADQQWLQG